MPMCQGLSQNQALCFSTGFTLQAPGAELQVRTEGRGRTGTGPVGIRSWAAQFTTTSSFIVMLMGLAPLPAGRGACVLANPVK